LPSVHVSVMSKIASFDTAVISPADASHALWIFGGGSAAIRPGTFTEHLMAAIAHADPVNLLILTAAFPGPVAAIALASRQIGGVDTPYSNRIEEPPARARSWTPRASRRCSLARLTIPARPAVARGIFQDVLRSMDFGPSDNPKAS